MLPQDVPRCPGVLAADNLLPVQPCIDCRRRTEPAAGPWQVNMQPVAWQVAANDWRCVKRREPVAG